MKWQYWFHSNGFHITTIQRPGSQLVAYRVCIKCGSRYDGNIKGLAHLVEHMLLNGTRNQSINEIDKKITGIGGVLNAQTGKDYLSLYCVVPKHHWQNGIDLLMDIIVHPLFDSINLIKEKKVIREEINLSKDSGRQIYSFFSDLLWPNNPLHNPILGEFDQIKNIDCEVLEKYYKYNFTTGNISMSACGDVDPNKIIDRVQILLKDLPIGEKKHPEIINEAKSEKPRFSHRVYQTNQVYLMLGMTTVGITHPDRISLIVLERILGMGLSARLPNRLREEMQLCYSVSTSLTCYEDVGYFAVNTSSLRENVKHINEVILNEFMYLLKHGVSTNEIHSAKENYIGLLMRRYETNLALASIAAKEDLLDCTVPLSTTISRIQAVKRDDVLEVAAKYLTNESYVQVTIGPYWNDNNKI